jgi:hypothetical protein
MRTRLVGASVDFPKVMTVIFILIAVVLATHHELWRDEIQPWLIAQHSSTLGDLYRNMEYEGHTMLWPLILYAITRFSRAIYWIQIVHLAIAAIAAYIFLRFSPLGKTQKALFVLGYFSLYEYCIVCRPYVLGLLLVYCFCALYARRSSRNFLALAAVVFLLCQTSAYGVLLAFGLVFMMLFDLFHDREWKRRMLARKAVLFAAAAVIAAGVALSAAELKPPEDTGFAPQWYWGLHPDRLGATAETAWRAYVPVPRVTYEFWNTNIVTSPVLIYVLSSALVAFFVFSFLDKPAVLGLYCSGTLAIMLFTYVKYLGKLRHYGNLFILLAACLWLAETYPSSKLRAGLGARLAGLARAHKGKVVWFILVSQLAAAVIAGTMDFLHPFSAAKEVAGYLETHGLADMLIVGDKDYAAMGVSGYLGREIYYPRARGMGSYVIYNEERRYMRPAEVFHTARRLSNERKEDVLVLLDYKPDMSPAGVVEIHSFTGAIIPTERFYLYLMEYGPEPPPPTQTSYLSRVTRDERICGPASTRTK